LAAAGLGLSLALVGCSGHDPAPKVEPSSPGSSPAASSGSPSPSSVALSPEETVRAWVAARNSALQDGNVRPVRALDTRSCRTCRNSTASIVHVYRAGGHFETRGWTVDASRLKSLAKRSAVVDAALRYLAGRTFPSAGAGPVVYQVERHIAQFRLERVDGRWLISFIGFLS
jgi:hypothetical protein